MKFNLDNALVILERTPAILETMLGDLSEIWIRANEGKGTWSPYDIIGHLIHGEKTDWMPRAEIILSDNPDKQFPEFDRFAQFEESKGKSLPELLKEFKKLREKNLALLKSKNLTAAHLAQHGIHPSFGMVTLSQLLSTWVVHDLNHLSQISRVMAKQYKEEVGPWISYLGILQQK